MNDQRMFRQVVGITLALVLVGLFSATSYAAGPGTGQVYRALPAANHCAGISSDAAGSILLAANPELSAACRFAKSMAQHEALPDASFANDAGLRVAGREDNGQRAREAEAARYTGLAESYNRESGLTGSHVLAENPELNPVRFLEASRRVAESTFAAANPEVQRARHYTPAVSDTGLQQKMDAVQRYGLAEVLEAENDGASSRQLTLYDIQRLDQNESTTAVEK